MSKKEGYSREGFFGEMIHYDGEGKKIGTTIEDGWGGYDHFDADGKRIGSSGEGFFGEMIHRDTNGKNIGTTIEDGWGGYDHFNAEGKRIGSSGDDIISGYNHRGIKPTVNSFSLAEESHNDENRFDNDINSTYLVNRKHASTSTSKVVKKQKRIVPKDWERPELVFGWIIFLFVFIALSYVDILWLQWIIRVVIGFKFDKWRRKVIWTYTQWVDIDENIESGDDGIKS